MTQANNPFGALKGLVQTKPEEKKIDANDKKARAAMRFASGVTIQKQQGQKVNVAPKASVSKVVPLAKVIGVETETTSSRNKKSVPHSDDKRSSRQYSKTKKVAERSIQPQSTDIRLKTTQAQKGRGQQKPVAKNSGHQQTQGAMADRTQGASPNRRESFVGASNVKRQVIRTHFTPPNPVTCQVSCVPGLPVSEHQAALVEAIQKHRVIIVCGETGSGKTTQLPKICLMAGRGQTGMIGHTQPRRIAASSVAKRIAQELNTPVGEVVGYKVRFTDQTQPGAAIKLMTDGILLAETQGDPLLKAYDTIIIDEAHERSINIDFLLGYLKQLLQKRDDLRVIVTSATIDAERFAEHFKIDDQPAPIFNISGRMYPVEVRYRPVQDWDEDDDRTLMDAVADACDELEMAGRGDILVFLPGEREIREAAEVLSRRHRLGTVDILPLFARLSVEDQERVFKPGNTRRIVLATNVAETSITVPGIRYVVDTGLARVKRYSYRNKVEQLQIEPISQASANQRAGRCGRVANGICIRLFSQEDWNKRPPFTDPEIIRSNLAGVILRMKSLKLGDVREFPFVQAPPPRAIADGLNMLAELHAILPDGALTPTGYDLSRLPVDPKLGRMLLEAHRRGCLKELLIIVSGLSVQDPRERPLTSQQAADQAHQKFAHPRSDFMSYIAMWQWYHKARENKESNRLFQQQLQKQFLSPRRMREWTDVWRQLNELVGELGWTVTQAESHYNDIHWSLLTGLLGNVGCRQVDADLKSAPYLGARGIRFWPWPGSVLAKKGTKWVMASELVETTRLYARGLADIEPEWLEQAGAHLIKKSWTEPHWEKKRGEVVAFERGALYGLTVYSGRRVSFAKHDPVLSRELFIREALVGDALESNAPFLAHNRQLIAQVRDIENKARRLDVLVDDEIIVQFYDAILPPEVVGGVSFETWRKKAEADNPKILYLTKDILMRHQGHGVSIDVFPKKMRLAGIDMNLTYHFEPGAVRDGVTLTVPLIALNQVDSVRCQWLVPGMIKEKVRALIKSLPQRYRRHCVPIERYAEGFFDRTNGGVDATRALIDALIDDLQAQVGIRCERTDFKLEFLAPHLFMNFKVVDEHGRQLGMGRNLAQLRAELGAAAQKTFQGVAESDQSIADELSQNITTWSFGVLPELMEIRRKGLTLIGHPALVDRKDHCSLEVFDDLAQAQKVHMAGLRRLFLLQLREQVRYLQKQLSPLQSVQMQAQTVEAASAGFQGVDALIEDVIAATVQTVALVEPYPNDVVSFGERKDKARSKLNLVGLEYLRLLQMVSADLLSLSKKLQQAKAWPAVVQDIQGQLRTLFSSHFILETPYEQLKHYPRYVKAICARLEKLRNAPERDAQCMQQVQQLQVQYQRELAARKGQVDERLREFGWQLQELRVSLFAQELRTPYPVSVKRLMRSWEALRRL